MNTLVRMLARGATVAAVAVLGLTAAAAPALAHNQLTGSTPADETRTNKVPKEVKLKFLNTLDPATTELKLTDPDGEDATDGEPKVKKNAVSVKLKPTKAGVYTASYQVLSDDGHPIKGKITFRLTKAAMATVPRPEPTPSAEPSPSVEPTPATDPIIDSSPVATAGPVPSGGFNYWWVVGLGAVVILLGLMEAGRRARKEA
ncbi:hypothetical protein GCM10010123_12200 [Pilimelia anulata]|uniref:CopC domain-containing protein n=1 Tax=Pilimelia anulata TaxID=53371 RepID=A0A8J3F967_9ACTN|nr:copper resistance CopC family protein [Pilimelia anulata]GGJ84089.1 hypothetical protein GCM10010123_12200 [Pilimelia anulata]